MTTKKTKSTAAKKPRKKATKKPSNKLEALEETTGKKEATNDKLSGLSFADGKDEEKIQKAKELEELVGLKQVNPYGTTIPEVFDAKLRDMALVDMQALAVSVGVFPSGNTTSLKKKLKKGFDEYLRGSSSFIIPPAGSICQGADRDSEEFKKALELMKEGL
tara:strand:+ start:157 stop:642 length:486 start_codon:yes stop_codon:yes gene_type:complete